MANFLDILAEFMAIAIVMLGVVMLLLVYYAWAFNRKSYALLYQWLTPTQRRQWKFRGRFSVKGKSGCVYIISRYAPYNIMVKCPNGLFCYMCIAPVGVPDGDKLLAQKILFETDELRAMEIANFRNIPWDM